MKTFLAMVLAATLVSGTSALAQTTSPATAPAAMSAEKIAPPATQQAAPTQNVTKPSISALETAPTLSAADEKTWIGKQIYTSDNENLGKVAGFERDPSGKVTALHVGYGGFYGIFQTQLRVMSNEFKLQNDRVVLTLTKVQAKNLPKV